MAPPILTHLTPVYITEHYCSDTTEKESYSAGYEPIFTYALCR